MYIGVLYCSDDVIIPGREIEKLADYEITDTAAAVKSALEKKGHQVKLVKFDSNQVAELCKYEGIFNLTESICGFQFAEVHIAKILEDLGVPFTGSGSAALWTCLYKSAAKTLLKKYGIRTPRFETVNPGEKVKTNLEFPLIVKPDHEDGGIGIKSDSVVQSMPELVRKITEIHQVYRQAALVEEFIDGRDIKASIIGNGDDLTVFPLSEIVFSDDYVGPRILTFEEKWVEESQAFQQSASHCPCVLEDVIQDEIKMMAITAFRILECRDYAIVEFRLEGDMPYLIEVNPNPCINPVYTGFILAGEAYGFNYDEIINKILMHSMGKNKMVLER
jgi:D-alanine-D-alanine ligase